MKFQISSKHYLMQIFVDTVIYNTMFFGRWDKICGLIWKTTHIQPLKCYEVLQDICIQSGYEIIDNEKLVLTF